MSSTDDQPSLTSKAAQAVINFVGAATVGALVMYGVLRLLGKQTTGLLHLVELGVVGLLALLGRTQNTAPPIADPPPSPPAGVGFTPDPAMQPPAVTAADMHRFIDEANTGTRF